MMVCFICMSGVIFWVICSQIFNLFIPRRSVGEIELFLSYTRFLAIVNATGLIALKIEWRCLHFSLDDQVVSWKKERQSIFHGSNEWIQYEKWDHQTRNTSSLAPSYWSNVQHAAKYQIKLVSCWISDKLWQKGYNHKFRELSCTIRCRPNNWFFAIMIF